jgi:hypothetical protein
MVVLSKVVNVDFVNEQPALESVVHASILSLSHPRDTLVFEKVRLIEVGPYLRISQPPFSQPGTFETTSRTWLCTSVSGTSIIVNYWYISNCKGYERKWMGLI